MQRAAITALAGRQRRRSTKPAVKSLGSFHAQSKEIIFSSGATEADNLAIKGVLEFSRKRATTSSLASPNIRRSSTVAAR